MPQAASEITRDDLLAFLKGQGFPVTPYQLLRWHDWGLLPQPRREGLGRGKGTVSYYRRGAALQARALARLLARRRSLHDAGWGLWMLGFPVTDWARPYLLDELKHQKREFLRAARSLRGKGWLAKQVSRRRAPKGLERLRKVAPPENTPRVFQMLVALRLGSLRAEDYSEDDWALLQDATVNEFFPDLIDDPELPGLEEVAAGMAKLSSEINLDRTIAEIKALPNKRLEQYRNEVQWLFELYSPPDERPTVLVSRDDFLLFFRARHLNPDGELGIRTWMQALGQTRPPASPLQRWLAAGRSAAAGSNLSSTPTSTS